MTSPVHAAARRHRGEFHDAVKPVVVLAEARRMVELLVLAGDFGEDAQHALFGKLRRGLFGPGMQALHIGKAQLFAERLQKADALVQTVQQRQLDRRAGYLQRQPGESRAGAHVDHASTGEVGLLQEGRAIEKVKPCRVLFPADGGEIHDPILLIQIVVIDPIAGDGLGIGSQLQRLETRGEDLFQHGGQSSLFKKM